MAGGTEADEDTRTVSREEAAGEAQATAEADWDAAPADQLVVWCVAMAAVGYGLPAGMLHGMGSWGGEWLGPTGSSATEF